jgi:hypothetical protein
MLRRDSTPLYPEVRFRGNVTNGATAPEWLRHAYRTACTYTDGRAQYKRQTAGLLAPGVIAREMLHRDTTYRDEVLRGIPQSLQATVAIVPQFGHDRFLPNLLQFINDSTILRYNLATDKCR